MLRVVTVWTGKPGCPWYTTQFYAGSGSVDAEAAVDKAAEFNDAIMSQQAAGIKYQIDPFVASVAPADGSVTGGYVTAGHVGTVSSNPGDMLPAATQVLVVLRTGNYTGGREVRGKLYLPGITSIQSTDDGRLDDGFRITFDTAFADIQLTGPDLLVWSRKNGTANPVSVMQCAKDFAVLRSRRD